jgi:anti-sigma factor RsiW
MSCSPFDLRDYFLKELPHPQQLQVEAHLKNCAACTGELEQLRGVEAALFCLRDEEIPQRIAFVSDKIFEPSPLRRWFSSFWGSAARLGFASAAMLSAALVFSASQRTPAPATGTATAVNQPAAAQQPAITREEIDRRIQDAVVKAVAEVETRYAEKSRLQMTQFQREVNVARDRLMLAHSALDMSQRRENIWRANAMVTGPPAGGELK